MVADEGETYNRTLYAESPDCDLILQNPTNAGYQKKMAASEYTVERLRISATYTNK